MKLIFNASRSVAPAILLGFIAPCLSAAPLTGVGYIQLEGDNNNSDPASSETEGAKFIWSPSRHSLFVGFKPASIHLQHSYSVSLMGATANPDSIAIGGSAGEYGVAVGFTSQASESVAIGRGSNSLGGSSIAIATVNDDGNLRAEATNTGAIAIGSWSKATAIWATAIGGISTTALGDFSNAFGAYSYAVGDYATALGYGSGAIADHSFAAGSHVYVYSYGSVALGYYNKGNIRRDGVTVSASTAHAQDPLLSVGNGTSSQSSNAFTLYRDGVARFEGAVQIKAGAGYLTIQPGGTTNRTLTLPDTDGALLATTSSLDATKLSGAVPSASLPAVVTQVGATVELDSAETTGNLPWSRVADKPATLSAYGIADGISVQREVIGGVEVISTPLRIKPQGDIPMFVASP